ncbi:HAD-IIIA family hydrolase [bacterium]|nr:HAD-IIIA family hydrolase [bacterium]
MITAKIRKREELVPICEFLRSAGKTVGFTSGAFDLLHAGHADYLEKAKALCDTLVVGVNSDRSVREYKGPDRPVVPESQRLKLVAALESVDYVFLFDERRNRANLEALKPRFYIKAGDYSPEELTSSDVLSSFGGEIRLIPITEAVSSSDVIGRILASSGRPAKAFTEKDGAVHIERRQGKRSPAVFLDRDGTVIEEAEYLHEPERIRVLPNALEGMKRFQDMGYRIVLITNQPGIGLGYYTKEDFYRVNRVLFKQVSDAGVLIDKVYFCPHGKSEKCDCRKPGQALVRRAEEELNLDLTRSVMIGDKTSDIETGRRAGMKTVIVRTGFCGKDGEYDVKPDWIAGDLLDAAKQVLHSERKTVQP